MCLVSNALAPYVRIDQRTGRVCVDPQTGRCEWPTETNTDEQKSPPPVWCGGDASCASGSASDPSQTTVESANDGKTAAYYIHEYLQVKTYILTQLDENIFLGSQHTNVLQCYYLERFEV